LTKYVGKIGIIKKYVKICTYGKICKMKYSSHYIGNWLKQISHLPKLIYQVTVKICMYLHKNPSPSH